MLRTWAAAVTAVEARTPTPKTASKYCKGFLIDTPPETSTKEVARFAPTRGAPREGGCRSCAGLPAAGDDHLADPQGRRGRGAPPLEVVADGVHVHQHLLHVARNRDFVHGMGELPAFD